MGYGSWKGQGKGGQVKGGKPAVEEEEIEVGGDEDDDDDSDGEGQDDADEEWLAFQSAILLTLVKEGRSHTSGKLGALLGAKKKPVAAALFALLESGLVMQVEGSPPKWSAMPGTDCSDVPFAPVPDRYLYDDSKKKAGLKATNRDFETLKLLVRSHFRNGSSVTAGQLGYKLGATKKVINGALYACEKEGTAWTVADRESGVKARWAGQPANCSEPLPLAFSYDAHKTVEAGGSMQPPAKRARTGPAPDPGTSDPFEVMKMLLHAHVAKEGERGVSSGKLGYELAADRKAITAALYACQQEGLVQNLNDGGQPKWVSIADPSPIGLSLDIPERFAYKGAKAPVAAAPVRAALPVVSGVAGLNSRQQAALSKKGQGKGAVAGFLQQPAEASVAVAQDLGSPVATLNNWAQKAKRSLSFSDAGQDPETNQFINEVSLDGQSVAVAMASNKKQAKTNAAAAALANLGLV
jgi:hypothetical protein